MGYLKGKNALMIFERHANLKYKFGNRQFWSRGHDVSTAGLNEVTIAEDAREQEKHNQMLDQISTKAAEDPFRGRQVIAAPDLNKVKATRIAGGLHCVVEVGW